VSPSSSGKSVGRRRNKSPIEGRKKKEVPLILKMANGAKKVFVTENYTWRGGCLLKEKRPKGGGSLPKEGKRGLIITENGNGVKT